MKDVCYWGDPGYVPHAPLGEDIETDVLIIGGGVAGLFTAYHLLKEGVKDIVVLEGATIGSGSTGRSAGMLTSDNETAHWSTLVATYGEQDTKLFFDAQKRALSTVARLIKQENIACDFGLRDYYVVGGGLQEQAKVMSEFMVQKTLGGQSELLTEDAFKGELTTALYDIGQRMEQGITVDPMRFIQGVGMYLASVGVRVYEHSHVVEVSTNEAKTTQGSVRARYIVSAQGPAETHERLENYVTTIGLTPPLASPILTAMALEDQDMFADLLEPSFFYAKVTGENRLMIGYGDDVVTSSKAEVPLHTPHIDVLTEYLHAFCPTHPLEFEYAWSGVFSLSKDPLPFVAIHAKGATIAGVGSQIASVALAEYIAHMYVHGDHPLHTLFSTQRSVHTS